MKNQQPLEKELVLIGGGHSHAIALRNFAMNPLPGVRIILISEQSNTPYSGMLPGHVAGHYTYEECHIDLRHLATAAQAQLYVDRAIDLDLAQNRVICAGHPPVRFDILSIDIGSTPELPDVPGILDYSVPVKPWRFFLQQWQQVIECVTRHPDQPISIGVVGGGAGGVELVLTIQHKLQRILQSAGQPLSTLTLHLFHRGAQVMTGHNARIRQRFQQILSQQGINLHLKERYRRCKKAKSSVSLGFRLSAISFFGSPEPLHLLGLDNLVSPLTNAGLFRWDPPYSPSPILTFLQQGILQPWWRRHALKLGYLQSVKVSR